MNKAPTKIVTINIQSPQKKKQKSPSPPNK